MILRSFDGLKQPIVKVREFERSVQTFDKQTTTRETLPVLKLQEHQNILNTSNIRQTINNRLFIVFQKTI